MFAVTTASLEPVPDWTCRDPPQPMRPTPVRVKLFWTADEAPIAQDFWDGETRARLPIDFRFSDVTRTEGLDVAWAHANANRDQVVVVLTDQYYRGPVLNDRLEGFACGNLAVVNVEVDCAESIVAHEIGHVLGLGHTSSGLMRPRSVACDDELVERQAQWLQSRYVPLDRDLLEPLAAEGAEGSSDGNADAEPAVEAADL